MTQTRIVRGTGVVQVVNGSNFEPGETVSATVNSTPFDLAPVVADASGNVRFTFPVGADFELGAHRVEVTGSVSGALPVDRERTAFTVVTKSLPATGMDPGGLVLGGVGAAALLAAGAGLLFLRRKQDA
ncbi:LPXTG cell wall anchor domain-containing protein [Microbacterium yannicii]|uniref:LPXTG cell wall anchor domain-containing protein n=1 Tax=Microbacterium yannicii TaxID=671622 RepID=UPI0012FB51B9|nr:LPXTG cell wall anchor domain-containing protein [Microbacterium yannicii]